MKSRRLLGLAVSVLMLGCASRSGEAPPEAMPDAGAEDAAVDVGEDLDVDLLVEKLCPGACDAAKECDAEIELNDCLEQCAKEIAGEGYLIPEVAIPFFGFVNEDDNLDGQRCDRMKRFDYWKWSSSQGEGLGFEVLEPATLESCVKPYSFCMGSDNVEAGCWFDYYRYNSAYRSPILECLQAPCSMTWRSCICERQVGGQPWLAIPHRAPKNSLEAGMSCPSYPSPQSP